MIGHAKIISIFILIKWEAQDMNYKNKTNNEQTLKEIYDIETHFEGKTDVKQIFKEMLEQKLRYTKIDHNML